MAELADALVLGSSVHDVQVQVLLSALTELTLKRLFQRLFYYLDRIFDRTLLCVVQNFQKSTLDGLRCGLCLAGQNVAVHSKGVHVQTVAHKALDLSGG